jgi:hypothetical protein
MSSFDNNDLFTMGEAPDNMYNNVTSSQTTGFFSKLALMILLIIVVVFTVKFSILLILYFLSPSSSPVIFNGKIDGTIYNSFSQNPALSKSKTISRSKNEDDGLEFTWSTWLYIQDTASGDYDYNHIFSKGDGVDNIVNDTSQIGLNIPLDTGMLWPNASPGLYLKNNSNELRVSMTTFGDVDGILPLVETIDIDNIPLNKWINVIIRVKGLIVDVYINGIIVKRHVLQSTPKQNYGNIHTGLDGGFNGFISCLRYFDYAIEVGKINSIIKSGPCLKSISSEANKKNKMPYMSSRWYFDY